MMLSKPYLNWPLAEYPINNFPPRTELEASTHRCDVSRTLHPALPNPPTPTTHQLAAPTMRATEDQLYLSQETGTEIT